MTYHGQKLPLYKRGRTIIETIDAYSIPVPETGCWIWLGATQGAGYGTSTRGGRQVKAHRASYEAYKGPIPEGLCVCHKCDVPLCVNPDHLFLGTQLDNALDRERKGRGNQPRGDRHPRRLHPEKTIRGDAHYTRRMPGVKAGERNGRAALTEEDVRRIRSSSAKSTALAALYGVTKTQINRVRSGRQWGHVS